MAYDIGGFVNYWTGNFGGSSGSGGSSVGPTVSLSGGSGFSNGNQLFGNLNNWNDLPKNVSNPTWDPDPKSSNNADVPAITHLGNWPTAAGLGGAARESLLGSALQTTVDVGVTSYSPKDFKLSEADVADVAFNSFNRAFRPLTDGGARTGMHEFGNVLGGVLSGTQDFTSNDLITQSNELVNNLANMGDEDIALVISDFKAGLRTKATLTEENEGGFDSYANAMANNARPKLTMIRNAARSLVELRGRDKNFVLDPRVAGETYTQFGANLNKGEKLRNIVISMGIIPAPAGAQGADGAAAAGGPTITQGATNGVGLLLLDGLKDYKITNPDQKLLEIYTSSGISEIAHWASKLESARSAILDPNMDNGTAADDGAPGDSLIPSSSQGVTLQNLMDYQEAVDAFESLPIYIDANGKPQFKPAFLNQLAEAERADRGAQLGAIGATARNAKVGVDMLANDQERLMAGHFKGEYLHAANSLFNQGVALMQAGKEAIRVGDTSVTLEEIRKAFASGEATAMVENLDGKKIPFNTVDFLASDAGAVAKLNDYIEMARNYATAAPTIMTKLAGAVDQGFFYNTNMLTGEKTMNGSNWLQLLLATGGIITPIATMLYQSEREQRATRKNQEYADRVRAEDREFQERLLKMQLASAETQAGIAAESRNKAVATGSSRTGVTINSPTQSR